MKSIQFLLLSLAVIAGVVGCSPVKEEQITVKPQADALAPARSLLESYANGQPMTSEVTQFPKMVEDVRAVDPAKADILQKGLEDLQKSAPNARPAKARDLLKKLA
jgi:hypothetical protein